MKKYVIKRNGIYEHFESFKIKDAIQKAFHSVSQTFDPDIYDSVLLLLQQSRWGIVMVIEIFFVSNDLPSRRINWC